MIRLIAHRGTSSSMRISTMTMTSVLPRPHQTRAFASESQSKFVFEGTEDNFDELVLESKNPVIIDVHAEWCPPCKMLGPILEKEVDALKGKVTLVTIDSDEFPSLARSLRVSSLPTVFGVNDGKQVEMFVGYPGPQKVKEFVAKMAGLGAGNKENK